MLTHVRVAPHVQLLLLLPLLLLLFTTRQLGSARCACYVRCTAGYQGLQETHIA
jgi:hypothetical protein